LKESQPTSSNGAILGIDPGLAATGWALLDVGQSVLGHGTIRTEPGEPGERLLQIVMGIEALLETYPVGEAALEELFMGRNRTSFVGVAQARGAILLTLCRHGVETLQYKPSQVKSVVTGYGLAGKAQIARMLAAQLGLNQAIDEHAADAIAIALCHTRSRRLLLATNGQSPKP
jgi:crossover junction endodeoxyribonuclease RuvC